MLYNACMKPAFQWIPVGVEGGLDEANLSAHLIAPVGSDAYVMADAGTIQSGLRALAHAGCFAQIQPRAGLTLEGTVLHDHVKAFLISHPYLDHLQGMVTASPTDAPKPLMSLAGVIGDIRDHVFNWRTWPNFGTEGEPPVLGQYTYVRLAPGVPTPIEGTGMTVEALPLAHGEHTDSAAFLIESGGRYVLYMGDTGPDEVEKSTKTAELFRRITPLVKAGRLHAVSIETSYVDERADEMLYSHLTPKWVMKAFAGLAAMVDSGNPESALRGLRVLITHIKPDFSTGRPVRERVTEQLHAQNSLGLELVFLEQGRVYKV